MDYKKTPIKTPIVFLGLIVLLILAAGCSTAIASTEEPGLSLFYTPTPSSTPPPTATPPAYAWEPRPAYDPGQLVAYEAQTGDTLHVLARRFNTTVEEILAANDFIPENTTTMPPGMPMQIPIYYLPFWGPPNRIIPDSQFVNGPAAAAFDTTAFVYSQPGWLRGYNTYAAGENRDGAGIVDYVATNFSVSPMVLLALLEFQTGALSNPILPPNIEQYPLGQEDRSRQGLYLQLIWAANTLNNSYYAWRTGNLLEFDRQDGRLERPDPWQNAASVSIQKYFVDLYPVDRYLQAVSPEGIAAVYASLFGDPWLVDTPHIEGSLQQPPFILPFEPRRIWAYTGGPHTGWGTGRPFAAIDFAPPSSAGGCIPSKEWATAVASGVIVRTDEGVAVLDLDMDGDERTGWVVFYLHLAEEGRAVVGDVLAQGDPIGHPSCEGGTSTGSHIHIARKYNGEWINAEGPLAFDLEGWIAHNGDEPYQGTLTKFTRTITACECSNQASFILREE